MRDGTLENSKPLGGLETAASEYRNADPVTETVIANCCVSWTEMFLKGPRDLFAQTESSLS